MMSFPISMRFAAVALATAAVFATVGAATLPDGYTELEFVQGDGKTYVDSGYKPSDTDCIEMKVCFVSVDATQTLFCSRGADYEDSFTAFLYQQKIRYDCSVNSDCFSDTVIPFTDYVIRLDAGSRKAYLNGEEIDSALPAGRFSPPTHWSFFASHQNWGALNYYGTHMMFYAQVWNESGTLVRSYVPCRRASDSAIGLYECVTGTFIQGSGEGSLKAGPDLLGDGYREMPYIQGAGYPVYINTGYVPNGEDCIETKVRLADVSKTQALFCTRDSSGNNSMTVFQEPKGSDTTLRYDRISCVDELHRVSGVRNDADYDVIFDSCACKGYCNGSYRFNLYDGATLTPSTPLTFFASHREVKSDGSLNATNHWGTFKMYGARIWNRSGNLVHWYEPCRRNSDSGLGLYDLVDRKFLANAADSGAFTCGCLYSSLSVSDLANHPFTGKPISPEVTVTGVCGHQSSVLAEGADYRVDYENNLLPGTATVTVTGQGDAAGLSAKVTFRILPQSDARIRLTGDFSRKALPAGRAVPIPGLGVTDAAGNPLPASTYAISMTNTASTGTAYVWASVTSGDLAGALAITNFPIAVVPTDCELLDYVKCEGAQYVESGYTPSSSDAIEMRVRFSSVTNTQTLWCGRADYNDRSFSAFLVGGRFRVDHVNARDGGQSVVPAFPHPGECCTLRGDGFTRRIFLDGQDTGVILSNDTFTAGTEWTFFMSHKNLDTSTFDNYATYRFYEAIACDLSGKIVLWDLPCRRLSDGALGLYDAVAGAFLENKGSGAFAAGPAYADFMVDEPEIQPADGSTPVEPPLTIRDRATLAVLDTNNFTIVYSDNVVRGAGTVTVTGKAGTDFAGQSVNTQFSLTDRYFVDGYSRATEGDGRSWSSPMSLTNALAVARDGDLLCLRTGAYRLAAELPAVTNALTICGGCSGEGEVLVQSSGDVSTLTANGREMTVMTIMNGAFKPVRLERLVFTRGVRGIAKTDAGNLVIHDCAITSNVWTQAYGIGLSLTGDLARTTVVLSNCLVAANTCTGNRPLRGQGLSCDHLRELVLEDVVFRENGIPWSAEPFDGTGTGLMTVYGMDGGQWGSALYAYGVQVTARRCRFVANRGNCSGRNGSTVRLSDDLNDADERATCGGSAFDHCLWIGNDDDNHGDDTETPVCEPFSGQVSIRLRSPTRTVTLTGCTVAYNHSGSSASGAGVTVELGRAIVRNCIVAGNVRGATCAAGADLCLTTSNAFADVDYSLFTTNGAASVTSACATNLVLGAGVLYGDPLFVTPAAEMRSLLIGIGEHPEVNFRLDPDRLDEILSLDVHLRSRGGRIETGTGRHVRYGRNSPALDAGDPASDCSLEGCFPYGTGGRRVNLGCYGNTSEAAITLAPGASVLVR